MNIYLHLEISARELDSKLLLAILAAARGHEVVVANIEVLEKGLLKGWLPSGIFHTKSITPSESKINRHRAIINKGSKITSIDEEACIDRFNYEVPNFLIKQEVPNKITNLLIKKSLFFTRSVLLNKFFIPNNLKIPKSRIIFENYFN